MKFDVVVGNPPYQGEGKQQIYTDFYILGKQISEELDLIFPTGWQQPKNANNLGKLNTKKIKEDKQIVLIDDIHNAFNGVPGAEWTNIILWKKGFDNKLNGSQWIFTNGEKPVKTKLNTKKSELTKPNEVLELARIVKNYGNFRSMQLITSARKPYGLQTDIIKDPPKI